MKWIGLTGGLASGKSTVTGLLRGKGYPVIDADEIAKLVVAPGHAGLAAVLSYFGSELRLPDGNLDRRGLGRKVFGNPAELLRLENILHPLVQDEVLSRRRALANQGFRLAFYDVPLLFEKKLTGFDAVVVVTAAEDIRRARVRSRDRLSDEEIEKRLMSQLSLEEKAKQAHYVIRNDHDLVSLEVQVGEVLEQLKKL